MDSGVLNDLNATRLNMLIGEEVVKQSIDIADDDKIIDLLEVAMQKYFRMDMSQSSDPESEKEDKISEKEIARANESKDDLQGELKKDVAQPMNFKLNIKKDKSTNVTHINHIPVVFSPIPVRQSLISILFEEYSILKPDSFKNLIEEICFENTRKMLSDIFKQFGNATGIDQKIRLGLIIYRLLGMGDYILNNHNPMWDITFTHNEKSTSDNDYYVLGFTKGLFSAADEALFENLYFVTLKNAENLIIKIF